MSATVVLDLEGTLYTRAGLIAGALPALAQLRADGHRLIFATNTDSLRSDHVLARMRGFGIEADGAELFTALVAARRLLADDGASAILVLGSPEVEDELAHALPVVDRPEPCGVPGGGGPAAIGVSHVVVGDVRDVLDYRGLDAAFAAVFAGARLIALQRGRFFLTDGRPHLDTGAVVAAIEYAAGVRAQVVGKPSVDFLRLALGEQLSAAPESIWVVGDDRSSDIALARAAGVHGVAVRTGKFALQAGEHDLPEPEQVIDSIADLPELLAAARTDR